MRSRENSIQRLYLTLQLQTVRRLCEEKYTNCPTRQSGHWPRIQSEWYCSHLLVDAQGHCRRLHRFYRLSAVVLQSQTAATLQLQARNLKVEDDIHLQLSLVRPWQSAGRPEKDSMVILAMQSPIMVRSPGREIIPKMRHDRRPRVLHMWTPRMIKEVYINDTNPCRINNYQCCSTNLSKIGRWDISGQTSAEQMAA